VVGCADSGGSTLRGARRSVGVHGASEDGLERRDRVPADRRITTTCALPLETDRARLQRRVSADVFVRIQRVRHFPDRRRSRSSAPTASATSSFMTSDTSPTRSA